MTRWLDPQEMVAWRSVLHASTRLLDQLDRDLREAHGLTLPDYEILSTLSEAPSERLRMSHLAELALLSASGLTYRVGRLEERGLVVRAPCSDDGRAVDACLTASGRDLVEQSAPTHVAGVRRHLVDLSSRNELERLVEVLGRTLEVLGAPLP